MGIKIALTIEERGISCRGKKKLGYSASVAKVQGIEES